MKFRRSSLVLAVLLSLGVCANAWAKGSVSIGGLYEIGDGAAYAYGSDAIAIGTSTTDKGDTLAFDNFCISIGQGVQTGTNDGQPNAQRAIAVGYETIATGMDSIALGTSTKVSAYNSVALGSHSVAEESNVVSVGGTYDDRGITTTLERRIINVAAAKDVNEALTLSNFDYTNSKGITKLTIDGTDYNIAGVTVDASFIKDSENAVQSKVVQAEFDKVNTAIGQNKTAIAQNATDIADNKAAIAQNKTDIATNKTAIAQNAADIAVNTTAIAKNTADIATNTADIATNKSDIAKNKADIAKKADQADLNKETSERIAADTDLQNQINNIGGNLVEDVDRLRSDVKSVGAMAAAMAGLHPRFTGDGKGEFAAAVGTYEGKKATAIGAFYAPDERFMFSLGGAFAAGGKNMANLGVKIALDPRPRLRAGNAYSKAEVDAMLAENNAKFEKALAEKDAKYNELLARLEALESK